MGDKGVEGVANIDVPERRDAEPGLGPAGAVIQFVGATQLLVGH